MYSSTTCDTFAPIMTRRDWKMRAIGLLAGTESPALVAELLLCHVLQVERTTLIAHDGDFLSPEERDCLELLLERRRKGEPVAYILGLREFYGRDMEVDRSTLIPRPETEDVVDAALKAFDGTSDIRFLDLCTGSGCIAVTLAAERPSWKGVAVDIAPDALTVARRNAIRWNVSERVSFQEGDITEELSLGKGCFDLIISNPPYISEEEYAGLDAGVRNFEPRRALVTGPTGLELPGAVERTARRLLRPGGLFLMEHGWLQGEACRAMCSSPYWEHVFTGRDLAGRDRFLSAVRSAFPEV